jgi:hypothetical protein
MTKRSYRDEPPEGPHPCLFACGRVLPSVFDFQANKGWEWFTAYGAKPLHVCPACRASRAREVAAIKAELHVRPNDYPRIRAVSKTADAIRRARHDG